MLDLLIINGTYPDYGKNEMTAANVGIKDGVIYYIGTETPEAAQIYDAYGKVVSPGFIDIHMHEEDFGADGERFVIALHMLEMGVTTAVGGNCGYPRQSVAGFRRVVEQLGGSPINYMLQTGYNLYRARLKIGRYEQASAAQIREINALMRRDLKDGACGVSFGIEYDPGMTTEEIIYSLSGITDPGLIVSAHYRADSTRSIEALNEMIEISDAVPMKFQISHLSSMSAMGQMEESLRMIDEAMSEDQSLNYDTYPYNAFSTRIGSSVFENGCFDAWGKTYSDVILTNDPYRNVRCTKEIFEDARKNHPDMLAVAFCMNEDEIAMAVADKNGMTASDGILLGGYGHPRAAGTFPRVLGKYVREEKRLSLIDALRKMTLVPAERLELDRKGRIKIGCDADITVFDPETVTDCADFQELRPPVGIDLVLIRGKAARTGGHTVNDRLGRFIPYREKK